MRSGRSPSGWLLLGLASGAMGGTSCAQGAPEDVPPAALSFAETLARQGLAQATPSFGCSVHDGDLDGHPDIFFGNHGDRPRVLWGRGGGIFQAEVPFADEEAAHYDGHGATWVELGDGGRRELLHLVGAVGGTGKGPNRLLSWDEQGHARDLSREAGLELPTSRGRTPTPLDWDHDGDLDIAAVNDRREGVPSVVMVRNKRGRYSEDKKGPAIESALEFGLLADWTGDGALDLAFIGALGAEAVYDLSTAPPTLVAPALPKLTNVTDIVAGDFDGDLRTDLFVLRRRWGEVVAARVDPRTVRAHWKCTEEPAGFRVLADGPVSLELLPPRKGWDAAAGAEEIRLDGRERIQLDPDDPSTWGLVSVADATGRTLRVGFDGDSHEWTLTTTCTHKVEVLAELRAASGTVGEPVLIGIEQTEGVVPGPYMDKLLRGVEGGFALVEDFGVDEPTQCVSGVAADFDNDMDLDLFLACSGTVQNIPDRLMLNRGDGTFEVVPGAAGAAGTDQGLGDSVCAGDLDVDGTVDLVLANGRPHIDGPDQVFLNQARGNHWLELDLVGTRDNVEGIGARVVVRAGGRRQLREQGGGMHRRAQNHPRLHFGLADNTRADRIEITWPDGAVQILKDVPADRVLRVEQPPTPGESAVDD